MDFALSLLACGIVLSEGTEHNSTDCSSSNQGSVESRVPESNRKNAGKSKQEKKKKKKSIRLDESDEGYIVFCFGKDGEVLQTANSSFDENDASDHRTRDADYNDDDDYGIYELNPDHEVEWASSRRRIKSLESSCSYLSAPRTSSFAFPVLGWELMGSPAKIPRPEYTESTRKHNKRCLFHFPCCIF